MLRQFVAEKIVKCMFRPMLPTLKLKCYSHNISEASTIFALASGGIRCGIAVIRVSGVQAGQVMQTIGNFQQLPEPRKSVLRTFYDPRSNTVLDRGMVIWFPEPRSYTGEDTCEFFVHGGPAVVSSFLRSIGSLTGCRMAEPGEFTKRAFLNGKIKDLTEVDALHDLIVAETDFQRIQALNQMHGSLGELYNSWRNRMAKCLAKAEAYIDFGEDENIEYNVLATVKSEVALLTKEIKFHLQDGRKGERLRHGVSIGIIGKPNTGKSSLLNILCQRDAAIVSDLAGTTRDVIQLSLNLNGYPVMVADTAGIRFSSDLIELEGIKRAQIQASNSDIVVLVTEYNSIKLNLSREAIIHEQLHVPEASVNIESVKPKALLVLNKVDLCENKESLSRSDYKVFDSMISCKTTEGVDEFLEELTKRVASLCANPTSEAPFITQERYRVNLEKCCEHLEFYMNSSTTDLALHVNHLKNAINNIGQITGHIGVEEILDIIFRDFCIGK